MNFKRKHSIGTKLRIMICSIMLMVFIVIIALIYITVSNITSKEEIENIKAIARGKANEIGAWLGGTDNMLKAYAETTEMQSDDWNIIQPLLIKAYNRINDPRYLFLAYVRANGEGWTSKGKYLDARPLPYYKPIITENAPSFTTNPFTGATTNQPLIIIGHGIKKSENKNQGIMIAGVDGKSISEIAGKINIGNTGFGIIVDNTGILVAHPDVEKVMKVNIKELDGNGYSGMTDIGNDMINGIENIRSYTNNGVQYFMVYSPIPNSPNWTLGITIPKHYFYRLTLNIMKILLPFIVGVFIIVILISLSFTIRITKSLRKTSQILSEIAAGGGDLTINLPVQGADEIAEISYHFNQATKKINTLIKSVGQNTETMEVIGSELSNNMTETAGSVHKISENINGIKEQAATQAVSVSETATMIEKIIGTIKQLNSSIEDQAATVAQSSSAVEEMTANIASITQTLDKTNDVVKTLAAATADGKETITTANTATQKIAEESGSLLEASSVIQHIASQTNLLAMNAAIEAAHAGDAGKGFAVVAGEIRKLAEESSAQGKSITQTLKILSGEIEALSKSSKTAGEKFNVIFALSEQVKDMSNQLIEAMREQEHGSREVLSAIRTINTVTEEVQEESAEMLKGGEGVAQEMQKLDGLTRTIAESMNEMAAGAVQINNAVQEVNGISQKNKISIENLVKEVKRFKV